MNNMQLYIASSLIEGAEAHPVNVVHSSDSTLFYKRLV